MSWFPVMSGTVNRVRSYLRLTPFDTSTAEGRARERYRRAALTAVANGGARVVSLLTMFISIPVALAYLGSERYGVVVTVTALTNMLAFADFGLGNGLMNRVAEATGRRDPTGAERSISSAFFMLCGIAVALAVPFYLAYRLVPWAEFMNISPGVNPDEVSIAAAVFLASVLLNIPLGVVQRVQLAYQQGFVNSAWNAAGSLTALGALLAAVGFRASLPWIVLTLIVGPMVGNALNSVALFVIRRRDLRPRWSRATLREGRYLARVGFLFFVLQVTVAVAYQSGVVVAARVIGPQAATDYAVTFRLFMVVPTVLNMMMLPLWPAYAESIARGDVAFVRRTLRLSVLFSLTFTGLSSLVLVLGGPIILGLWVGTQVTATLPLLLGMAVWAVLSNSFNAVAMLLNGATVMRFQIATAISMAVVSLAASIVLASLYGVAGIIWGTVVAFLACTAVPTAMYLPSLMRGLERRVPGPAQALL